MLRHPYPSWSFALSVLEQAHERGCTLVQVHDVESGVTYTAPLATIFRRGFRFARGHGEQIALPLSFWRREDPKQPSLW